MCKWYYGALQSKNTLFGQIHLLIPAITTRSRPTQVCRTRLQNTFSRNDTNIVVTIEPTTKYLFIYVF